MPEQRCFGCGHPHLSAALETGEQRGSAPGVEMSGDFVEEEDGRFAAALGDQLRMGEHEAQQQRLLLARRRARRGHLLGSVEHHEVGPVRAFGRPPSGRIAVAVGLEDACEIVAL